MLRRHLPARAIRLECFHSFQTLHEGAGVVDGSSPKGEDRKAEDLSSNVHVDDKFQPGKCTVTLQFLLQVGAPAVVDYVE